MVNDDKRVLYFGTAVWANLILLGATFGQNQGDDLIHLSSKYEHRLEEARTLLEGRLGYIQPVAGTLLYDALAISRGIIEPLGISRTAIVQLELNSPSSQWAVMQNNNQISIFGDMYLAIAHVIALDNLTYGKLPMALFIYGSSDPKSAVAITYSLRKRMIQIVVDVTQGKHRFKPMLYHGHITDLKHALIQADLSARLKIQQNGATQIKFHPLIILNFASGFPIEAFELHQINFEIHKFVLSLRRLLNEAVEQRITTFILDEEMREIIEQVLQILDSSKQVSVTKQNLPFHRSRAPTGDLSTLNIDLLSQLHKKLRIQMQNVFSNPQISPNMDLSHNKDKRGPLFTATQGMPDQSAILGLYDATQLVPVVASHALREQWIAGRASGMNLSLSFFPTNLLKGSNQTTKFTDTQDFWRNIRTFIGLSRGATFK